MRALVVPRQYKSVDRPGELVETVEGEAWRLRLDGVLVKARIALIDTDGYLRKLDNLPFPGNHLPWGMSPQGNGVFRTEAEALLAAIAASTAQMGRLGMQRATYRKRLIELVDADADADADENL